jgi:hypothetical protein
MSFLKVLSIIPFPLKDWRSFRVPVENRLIFITCARQNFTLSYGYSPQMVYLVGAKRLAGSFYKQACVSKNLRDVHNQII